MQAPVNLRHLETNDVHLEGEIAPEDLDLIELDELIQVNQPLEYRVDVERSGESLLVTGRLALTIHCECARCLKPFEQLVELDPWNCILPLTGDEKVVIENDCVDLAPFIREDTLLAFPQHPLCKPDCGGLPKAGKGKLGQKELAPDSAWSELNKLKL